MAILTAKGPGRPPGRKRRHAKWVPKIAGRRPGRAAGSFNIARNGGARFARATIFSVFGVAICLARGVCQQFWVPILHAFQVAGTWVFCMAFFSYWSQDFRPQPYGFETSLRRGHGGQYMSNRVLLKKLLGTWDGFSCPRWATRRRLESFRHSSAITLMAISQATCLFD